MNNPSRRMLYLVASDGRSMDARDQGNTTYRYTMAGKRWTPLYLSTTVCFCILYIKDVVHPPGTSHYNVFYSLQTRSCSALCALPLSNIDLR